MSRQIDHEIFGRTRPSMAHAFTPHWTTLSMTHSDSTSNKPRAVRSDADRRDDPKNRDPISGTPGAHPVGTGVGAAAGGAIGAGIGAAVGGPVGAIAGGVGGAVLGGLGGKAAAEELDPTLEETYWRDNYKTRPYATVDTPFDVYRPAYRLGWEGWGKRGTDGTRKSFEDHEQELRAEWEGMAPKPKLTWDNAKDAVRDAWDRLGDGDRSDSARRRPDSRR